VACLWFQTDQELGFRQTEQSFANALTSRAECIPRSHNIRLDVLVRVSIGRTPRVFPRPKDMESWYCPCPKGCPQHCGHPAGKKERNEKESKLISIDSVCEQEKEMSQAESGMGGG
jgi:hypothetical protein